VEITLNETSGRLSGINEIFTEYTDDLARKIFEKGTDITTVNLTELNRLTKNSAVLFELFRPFGIKSGSMADLRNIIKGRTGSQIFTDTHRIIKNRKELIIEEAVPEKEETLILNNISEFRNCRHIKSARELNISEKFRIPSGPGTACLDSGLISFPLILRNWHHGDYFFPLGMNHKKKLSDYFIDRKYPVSRKEKTRVLESGGMIAWIVGERIDDRFRVTAVTKKVLIIKAQGEGRRARSTE
jgi:tRNA(Ile)-lysidine synthase